MLGSHAICWAPFIKPRSHISATYDISDFYDPPRTPIHSFIKRTQDEPFSLPPALLSFPPLVTLSRCLSHPPSFSPSFIPSFLLFLPPSFLFSSSYSLPRFPPRGTSGPLTSPLPSCSLSSKPASLCNHIHVRM